MLTSVLCCVGCRSTQGLHRESSSEVECGTTETTQGEVSGESEETTEWSDTVQTIRPGGDTTTVINSGRRTTQKRAEARASERRTEVSKEETHEQEEATENKSPVAEPGRQAGEPRWKCWVRDFASGFVACLLIVAIVKMIRFKV